MAISLHSAILDELHKLLQTGGISIDADEQEDLVAAIRREPEIGRLEHPEVRYEVTDHCNARCIMCPRDKHEHGREHGIMDLARYKKSIDEVLDLGAKKVVLTGFGEPFLDRTLEEKIAYAKDRGLGTYVISNGSAINAKRAAGIIEAGLDELRISFYGMRPETYNVVMAGLKFDVAMKNLKHLLQMRADRDLKTPKLAMSYLVMPENAEDVDLFLETWKPLADSVEVWKPHNFGDGRDYRARLEDTSLKSSCGRPENGPLQIQWNGEVIPCCYDYNNQIVLGNAFRSPVLSILNGAKYRLLRIAHRRRLFSLFPYCDQCDQLLPHADALVHTNRHSLPAEVAVKLSNTDLFNLEKGVRFNLTNLNKRYAEGLDESTAFS